jgi:hypothetical protein
MKKNKIKETVIKQEIRKEDGFTFVYELILSESEQIISYGLPLYSIKVDLTDPNGIKSCEKLSNVFADVGKAYDFFDKIVSCLATPIDLQYVFEDEMLSYT